jgi:aspartyl-tRNA(Asn)/glutamyl-tRNA(Gln) amidotransferase subunit A
VSLIRTDATELRILLDAKEVSAVEVAQAHLDRIDAVDADPGVHAFLHVARAEALAHATRVDAGEVSGPLAGIPVAIKDVMATRGLPTTSGSRILQGWIPPYSATVVTKLETAGATMLGKVNMDEFAMGSSTENSAYGPTRNPWDLTRIPGGSSGGSAAAVAAYETPLSVGTDTGGSIRQPAAVCGIVGVKPTYGSVSRYGLIAFSSSLDVAGPFGRTVADTALLHSAMAGFDPMDQTTIRQPTPDVVGAVAAGRADGLQGVRIGVVTELGGDGYSRGVQARCDEAIAHLMGLGAEVVDISCPSFGLALPAYYLIAPSECSSNLARFDAMRYGLRVGDDGVATAEEVMALTRAEGFGPEVIRRIILGTYALSAGYYDAFYGSAQKVRTLIHRDLVTAFTQVDVLVSPTTPTTAFPLGDKMSDPMAMYLCDLATIPANLAGVPAMSLPVGLDDGLPVGLQLMAPVMADDRLYRVGAALEQALDQERGVALHTLAPELKIR